MYVTSAAGRLQMSCSNTWHGKQLQCFTVPYISSVCGSFMIVQEKEGRKARAAAIADARRMGSALDACTLCITSARRPRHLTLAIGQASYLMLPARWAAGSHPCGFSGSSRAALVFTTGWWCVSEHTHVAVIRSVATSYSSMLNSLRGLLSQIPASSPAGVCWRLAVCWDCGAHY